MTSLEIKSRADGGKGCIEISPYQGGFYQMTEDDYVDPTFDAFYGYIDCRAGNESIRFFWRSSKRWNIPEPTISS